MFASSNPKQPFYVANKVNLNELDQQVLTKLFQPLVGVLGIGLYTTLVSEFDSVPLSSDYKTLYQLQDQMNTNLRDIFNSVHRLEAVGLLKTYVGENPILGDVIIFKLLEIPSPQQFFKTFLLSSLLQERIGIVAFERLVKEFTPRTFPGLEKAEDVSVGFFDVFHLNSQTAIQPPASVKQASETVGKPEEEKINLGNNTIKVDWDFLIDLFSSYHVKESEINKHRQEIVQMMSFYGLTEQEFVDNALITLSAGKMDLNMKAIENVINENYGRKKNRQMVKKQLNQEAGNKENSGVNKLSRSGNTLLNQFNQYTVIDYLYFLKQKKGGYVTANEKNVIYRLQNQYGLTPNLINAVVYTCLEYASVLTMSLADKIANDWLQAGVKTPEQAIKHIQEFRNRKKKRQYQVRKPVKKSTDWSNYKKKNTSKESVLSDEEINQIFKKFGKNN